MAIINIPLSPEKWLIFLLNDIVLYNYKADGACTSYSDIYTMEDFDNEEDWLIRLGELGVVPE